MMIQAVQWLLKRIAVQRFRSFSQGCDAANSLRQWRPARFDNPPVLHGFHQPVLFGYIEYNQMDKWPISITKRSVRIL